MGGLGTFPFRRGQKLSSKREKIFFGNKIWAALRFQKAEKWSVSSVLLIFRPKGRSHDYCKKIRAGIFSATFSCDYILQSVEIIKVKDIV